MGAKTPAHTGGDKITVHEGSLLVVSLQICILSWLGKRLSTCPHILLIQKALLQTFTSYELLSVIKLFGFRYFSVERDFFAVKQQELAYAFR